MQVAVQCGLTVGPTRQIVDQGTGRLTGHNSGLALLRAMIDRWPGLTLIDDSVAAWEADGFRVSPLSKIDVNRTLILSMDLLATPLLSYRLRPAPMLHPKIVNLWWANVSDDDYRAASDRSLLGLSAAHFPTFANSRKAMRELQDVIVRTMAPSREERATMSYSNLGIEWRRVPERVEDETRKPVVLFPGIYVFDRKRPEVWCSVLDKVHAMGVDFVGRVRVSPRHAKHRNVDLFTNRSWVDLAPQDKQDAYFDSLRSVDVALATSVDESYGLAFMEAMYAGAVGVLPARPWVGTLVPSGYPFVYSTTDEAVGMVKFVLENPAQARELVRVSGFTREWVQRAHDARQFWDDLEAWSLERYPRLKDAA